MKNWLRVLILAALIMVLITGPLWSETPETVARQFIDLVAKGDFTTANTYFDDMLKKIASPQKIEANWKAGTRDSGAFIKQLGARVVPQSKTQSLVYVDCLFEKATQSIMVSVSDQGTVVGFLFVPSTDQGQPAQSVVEQPLNVSDLPGALTIPKEGGPFPAIVLVQGSGPYDKDESFGLNTPFRDIAWGLAKRGIAALRYDKRTRVHPNQHRTDLTPKTETVDDAVAAAGILRKAPRIDPERIYVLGHGPAGMLIPRIGEADSKIAGFIIMAGSARPVDAVILEQQLYIGGDEKNAKVQAERVKSLKPGDAPVGAYPATYWLDIRDYNPPEAAKQLKQPMLILQPERDYQTTMQDFAKWKSALGSRNNVSFKTYPTLNHFFLPGEGKSTAAEYEKPGKVSEQVIDDIASWIKAR